MRHDVGSMRSAKGPLAESRVEALRSRDGASKLMGFKAYGHFKWPGRLSLDICMYFLWENAQFPLFHGVYLALSLAL